MIGLHAGARAAPATGLRSTAQAVRPGRGEAHASRAAHGRQHVRLAAVAALLTGVLLLAPLTATAAGSACDKTATATKGAVCADPVLFQLDSDLSAAAQRTRSAHAAQRNALQSDQLDRLARRDSCAADIACLRQRDTIRSAELDAMTSAAPFAWSGAWRLPSLPDAGGTLRMAPVGGEAGRTVEIRINAIGGAMPDRFQGRGVPKGGTLTLVADGCHVTLTPRLGVLDVAPDDACGDRLQAFFGGRDARTSDIARQRPAWSLVSLGLPTTRADESRLRALVGAADHARLLATVDIVEETASERDLDALGARVQPLGVRGLFTVQESLLTTMRDGRQWVAILGTDAQRAPQLRYDASDPAWAMRLPKTIEAWRSRFAAAPVRMMSALDPPRRVTGGAPGPQDR